MTDLDSKDDPQSSASDTGFRPSYRVKLEVDLLEESQDSTAGGSTALPSDDVLCLVISADEDARARIRRLLDDSGGGRVTTVEAEDVRSARSGAGPDR